MRDRKNAGRLNKGVLILLLGLLMTCLCIGCGQKDSHIEPDPTGSTAMEKQAVEPGTRGIDQAKVPDLNGTYDKRDDVALYIHMYGKLPKNYITKKEARELGWQGGKLEPYAPGKCIGGDYFGNYEGILPDGEYHECDIGTLKKERGPKRLIYSDTDIYYTDDHYVTFVQLYNKDGAL